MQHQWTPDTATVDTCACKAKRRKFARTPRSPTRATQFTSREFLAPGAEEWTKKPPPCTRPLALNTLRLREARAKKAARSK